MFKTREGLTPDNPNNPLGIYLIPEGNYKVRIPETDNVIIRRNDLQVGYYYYFTESHNPSGTVKMGGNETNLILGTTKWNEYTTLQYIAMYIKPDDENKIFYKRVWKNDNTGELNADYETLDIDYMTFKSASDLQYGEANVIGQPESIIETEATFIKPINAHVTTAVVKSIEDLDRTDSKILKLFRLPYCPISINLIGLDELILPENWGLSEGLIKYKKYDLPNLERAGIFEVPLYQELEKLLVNLTDHDPKNVSNESKLFNSDFYKLKLVYGQDSHLLKLENIDYKDNPPENINDTSLYVNFQATNTCNSDMLFTVDYSDLGDLRNESDYEKYFLVSPVNEETILSSDYVNYIRNGYNYDKKSQQLSIQHAKNQAIISGVSAMGSFGLQLPSIFSKAKTAKAQGAAGEIVGIENGTTIASSDLFKPNPPSQTLLDVLKKDPDFNIRGKQAAKLVFGGLVGQAVLNNVTNAVNAIENISYVSKTQKNQMAAKQASLQAEAVNLIGGGSVDLMKKMTGNKVHVMRYELRDEWKKNLYDLFDKFGYAHSFTEVPNVHSRIWYNYIQCKPELNVDNSYKLPKSWIENLKERYQIGVNVFHERHDQWNFDQDYENWETSLID